MKASFVDLRKKSGEIIKALKSNEPITVLYRGKPAAIMKPINAESSKPSCKAADHDAFGMWSDVDDLDVAANVREMRRGRYNDI